jgi:protein-disulfide isomerase
VSPSLYTKFEDALFPHAEGMTEASVRQLAADVAEAASVREAFAAELSSGRARARVLRDIELGVRLGLSGTPDFFYKGVFLTSEAGLAEDYIGRRLAGGAGH